MADQLSYEEAMREALKIKRSGQARGVSLQQLIKNIMLPAGPGQTTQPQPEGIGGVFEPVPVSAAQAMAAPPTKVVTPASPAPVEEGVEIKAPPPPKQYENPYLLRARKMAEQLAAMAPPGENAGVDQQAAYDLAKRKAERAQIEADITEAAKIRPEEEEIFAGREARVGERLAELQKERKSSKWKALAEAGFKMAQSNSPYFMQALASGMEAGVNGYDARKAKAKEEQSLLKEQTENVKLARIRAIDAARATALDAYRAGDEGALKDIQSLTVAREGVISGKTAESRVKTANLAPEVTQASIEKDMAAAEAYRAAADKDLRTDPNLRSTGGYGTNTTGMGQKGATGTLNALIRQEAALAKIAADRFADRGQRAAANAELKNIRMQIAWVKASMGLTGGQPAAPAGGGALTPDAVYDPRTGYRPIK